MRPVTRPDVPGALHFSHLKHVGRSPAHYRAALENPKDPTPAMQFGSLVHAVTLGGEYAIFAGDRRGKEWEKFKADNAGKLLTNEKDFDRARRCRDALLEDPVVRDEGLLEGEYEVPLVWDSLGRKRATRGIDVKHPRRIVELKTSTTTEPGLFRRACLKMAYHAQLADYLDAARFHGGKQEEAWIIGVEVQPPFAVTCFRLTPNSLDTGARIIRTWMERLLSCEAANEWPAYTQSAIDFETDGQPLGLIIDGEEVDAA